MATKVKKKKSVPRKPAQEVTYSEPFSATVVADSTGKSLKIVSERWYRHQLSKFKAGEKVTLVIHSKKPKRTDQQNRYYWGAYLPLIAEERGEKDLELLHELFKGKFLTKEIVEVMGEKVRVKGSTTRLSILEFNEFITAIENFTGVPAPETENWELAPLHAYEQDQ